MKENVLNQHFGKDHAANYDTRWERSAPLREALHFLMRMILLELPSNARILCVGAGTGAELLFLAQHFPDWQFTAVEPSAPMLDVCREKVERAGLMGRCEFHNGYLDSLPALEQFDAATSILVSQFLIDKNERAAFFREISRRLRPRGILISADLASEHSESSREYENAFGAWSRTQTGTTAKPPQPGWGSAVAVSAPDEIEEILESAAFTEPVLFYRALFIHAWFAHANP